MLHLICVTRENRLVATDAAKDAIAECGGWIDDFQLFSNKMTCIRFWMPETGAARLLEGLGRAGIRADTDTVTAVSGLAGSNADTYMTLQITFIHDEPDLRREVLAVPG